MKRYTSFRLSRAQWVAVVLLASSTALSFAVTIPNTFTAGTPAEAAAVNANFTALKNAVDALEARTGPGSISVSHAGFSSENEAETAACAFNRSELAYGRYGGTGVRCVAKAPISLPHGATLTGLHCTVFDNATGADQRIFAVLSRVNLTTGAPADLFLTAFSDDSTNTQVLSDTTPVPSTEFVDNNTFAYNLEIVFRAIGSNFTTIGNNLRLYGCRVSYAY